MKALTVFLFVIIFNLCACSQNLVIPKGVEWDYDYAAELPSNIIFDIFLSSWQADTSYTLYDSTQTLMLGFNLGNQVMYDNRTWYLFCRARRLTDHAVSFNSDTIDAYFPKILENQPMEFEILKTSVPK